MAITNVEGTADVASTLTASSTNDALANNAPTAPSSASSMANSMRAALFSITGGRTVAAQHSISTTPALASVVAASNREAVAAIEAPSDAVVSGHRPPLLTSAATTSAPLAIAGTAPRQHNTECWKIAHEREIHELDEFSFNPFHRPQSRELRIPVEPAAQEYQARQTNAMVRSAPLSLAWLGNDRERPKSLTRGWMKVARERELYLDACIVRAMKRAGEMGHAQLVADMMTQCRPKFVATAVFIKQRIEKLVEREFLAKRDEPARSYVYIA